MSQPVAAKNRIGLRVNFLVAMEELGYLCFSGKKES
jgi:hypothetical protein